MGCTTSSSKVQVESAPTVAVQSGGESGGQVTGNKAVPKKEKKNPDTLEDEAKRRRSIQGKTENMVKEEFERGDVHSSPLLLLTDITLFYEINNGAILGEGISGSVKICRHRSVSSHLFCFLFYLDWDRICFEDS
jgi:hypothetical protein